MADPKQRVQRLVVHDVGGKAPGDMSAKVGDVSARFRDVSVSSR